MDLKEALQLLEFDNENHWTSDGLPVVAVVSEILDRTVTRKEITEADPSFTRATLAPKDESVEAPEASEEELEERPDPRELLETADRELAVLEAELKTLQGRVRDKVAERQELDRQVTEEYDFKTDQDRRMAHIRAGNERRHKLALERQALLKTIDPKVLAQVQAPIDQAARTRKGQQHKVPPRIFNQTE